MIELQDILAEYGEAFAAGHNLLPVQHKAFRSILNCRTAALGGHVDHFDCGHSRISYNSCRNRNCPKCQSLAKERWVDARLNDMLPVPYYHVVFTLPQELGALAFLNSSALYGLLMGASAETLKQLCLSDKYLAVQTGFISVLHTWGQNLSLHPHVHIIIPSGGLTDAGQFRAGGKKFFIPVKVLAKKFRGKFLFLLKQLRGQFDSLDNAQWQALIDSLYAMDWYVYCKRPFKSCESVLRYLSRYTHKIAISNQRIISMDNGNVSFLYRNYKNRGKTCVMSLAANEFLRRFFIHVLPSGFRKIRYYGFLAPAVKKTKLLLCKKLLGVSLAPANCAKLPVRDLILKLTGKDIHVCPHCSLGKLIYSSGLHPPMAAN